MSTYNCGFDGNGIICAYGYMKMIEKRYRPKVIVYDIAIGFDLLEGDNHTFLGQLRYFYDSDGVDSILWAVDKTERYKMTSNMYRYNSWFPQLVMDNLHPLHEDNKGYRPLDKKKEVFEPKANERQETYSYDSLKLHYIERLINECEGNTTLVFAVSPSYKNTSDEVLDPIRKLCDKYSIPLINHFADSTFNNRKEYFDDRTHLNREGATEYSKVISEEIRCAINGIGSKGVL